MTEALVFKTSALALHERRRLLAELRVGLTAVMAMLGLLPLPWAWEARAALAAVAALLLGGLWRIDLPALLDTFGSRELRLQDNALELLQGKFTRLLFFAQLEQMRVIQSQDEKVLAIELRTLDGGASLRGYENMEQLFSALAARKPAKVLLEVEECRLQQKTALAIARAVFIAGIAAALVLFLVLTLKP